METNTAAAATPAPARGQPGSESRVQPLQTDTQTCSNSVLLHRNKIIVYFSHFQLENVESIPMNYINEDQHKKPLPILTEFYVRDKLKTCQLNIIHCYYVVKLRGKFAHTLQCS